LKIPFIKATNGCDVNGEFQGENGHGKIVGNLSKFNELAKLQGVFTGFVNQTCDYCSEDYIEKFEEDIVLFLSEGAYENSSQENDTIDVVELESNFIDFDEIIYGELEIKRLDYHKCEKCTEQ
jgi:hypothetical protein